jgi:hypothetical protein
MGLSVSREDLIKKRWASWVLVALISTVFWLVLGTWQRSYLAAVAEKPAAEWIIAAVAVVAVWLWQARRGLPSVLAFYDLRRFWVRPPYWFACVVGAMLALFLASTIGPISAMYEWSPDAQVTARVWTCVLLGLCVAILAVARILRHRASSVGTTNDGRATSAVVSGLARLEGATDDELLEWIKSDDEKQDFLDYHQIARRMAERLVAPATSSKDDRSQALLGALGSGKTTILRMVQEELKQHKDVEILEVQMWAYETARAAVTGVLDQIVDALGKHVNVVGLRGVSGAYAEAISKVPDGGVILAALRGRSDSPEHALNELDEIARVIGIRYVIWIEDLERFASTAASDDKLGVVRALLHGLHRLPSFTIVTATTELSRGFDHDKIARYVEHVPRLPAATVKRLCGSFLTLWEAPKPGETLISVDIDDGRMWREKNRYDLAIEGMLQVVSTPRGLKQALRRCDEVWGVLRGEVNLKQALAFSIVREASPKAYAFIEGMRMRLINAPRLKDTAYTSPANSQSGKESKIEQFSKDLHKLLGDEDPSLIDAVEALAIETFVGHGRDLLQGFGSAPRHVDYWHRFSALPTIEEKSKDQYVLRVMTEGTSDQALDLLGQDYGGNAAKHLARKLDWKFLLCLLGPCVLRHTRESGDSFESLWGILLHEPRISGRSTTSLIRVVEAAIDTYTQGYELGTISDLERWIGTWQRSAANPIDEAGAIALRQRIGAVLVRDVRDAKKLGAALKNLDSQILFELAGGLWSKKPWNPTANGNDRAPS